MLPCTITNRFPAHIRFFTLPNATLDHKCFTINAIHTNDSTQHNSRTMLERTTHSPSRPYFVFVLFMIRSHCVHAFMNMT